MGVLTLHFLRTVAVAGVSDNELVFEQSGMEHSWRGPMHVLSKPHTLTGAKHARKGSKETQSF